jgi:ATP/maltotriose-dependent transcriptional regulator MalT
MDDAPAGRTWSHAGGEWTNTRSTCDGWPYTTRRSSRRSRVEPLPTEVFDALSGPGGSTWSKRVPGLGRALAAFESPLVLVLDDLHAVTNLSCLDVLAALVDHVPAGSQVAIASREAPELPLARWRAQETERVLELRPHMGSLVDQAHELRDRVAATTESAGAWAMSLTAAELRLLPYLATHLTFPEIATRLFISRNTVKSEAVALCRKLGAASRSQAIERAVEIGLLESTIYPPRAHFTLEG